MATPTEHRIFFVVEALRRGWDIARIHAICGIDPWYLNRINDMVQVQESIRGLRVEDIDANAMRLLKQYGTSDAEIAALTGSDERFVRAYRKGLGVVPSMKTVDTCAAEFSSATEYHYKTYENIYRTSPDAKKCVAPDETTPADKPKAMILAPAPTALAKVSSSITAACTRATHWRLAASRPSWSTATPRPFRLTTTPRTACTLSRSPTRTSWTLSMSSAPTVSW